MQVTSTVGHAENSGGEKGLKELIQQGKKIIITTVHKFPFILDDIGTSHKGSRFAIRTFDFNGLSETMDQELKECENEI